MLDRISVGKVHSYHRLDSHAPHDHVSSQHSMLQSCFCSQRKHIQYIHCDDKFTIMNHGYSQVLVLQQLFVCVWQCIFIHSLKSYTTTTGSYSQKMYNRYQHSDYQFYHLTLCVLVSLQCMSSYNITGMKQEGT